MLQTATNMHAHVICSCLCVYGREGLGQIEEGREGGEEGGKEREGGREGARKGGREGGNERGRKGVRE